MTRSTEKRGYPPELGGAIRTHRNSGTNDYYIRRNKRAAAARAAAAAVKDPVIQEADAQEARLQQMYPTMFSNQKD